MQHPNLILFYVENPLRSAQFYERPLESPPMATFPTYVAFRFQDGLTLGLWSVKAKNFVSGGSGHRAELAFIVPDEAAVRALRERWHNAGVQIEQDLQKAVFGLTFVAVSQSSDEVSAQELCSGPSRGRTHPRHLRLRVLRKRESSRSLGNRTPLLLEKRDAQRLGQPFKSRVFTLHVSAGGSTPRGVS